MNRLLMSALLIALPGAQVFAKSHSIDCSVTTDYSLSIANDRLTFTGESSNIKPNSVVIARGRLLIDGTQMALSSHDQALLGEFESRGRVVIQETKSVALEGIDIARIALTEVFFTLAGDDQQKKAEFEQKINATMENLRVAVMRADSPADFESEAFERQIKQAVAEAMPMLVGTAVGMAMSAALSDNPGQAKALEARMDAMGQDIERKIKVRADELKIRAEALCGEIKRLDTLENQLEYVRPDGSKLNLLEAN